jgi:hypothetical protein
MESLDPETASIVSSMSQQLNNLFSFTAIGFTSQSCSIPPNAHIKISRHSYHCILHLDSGRHSMQWFLYDETKRTKASQCWAVDANG